MKYIALLLALFHPCRPSDPPDDRVPVSAPATDEPRPVGVND